MWKELFNSLLFLIFCLPENNKTISRKLILWEFKNGFKNFTILLSRNFQFLLSISSWQTHKRKKKLSVYRTISIYNLLENTDIELRGSLLRSMSVSYSIVCKILNLFSDFFFFFRFFFNFLDNISSSRSPETKQKKNWKCVCVYLKLCKSSGEKNSFIKPFEKLQAVSENVTSFYNIYYKNTNI